MIDADLPGGNEKTFLERLGANSKTQRIPAIVLCQNADLKSVPRIPTIVAYYVHKSETAWNRIETFIHELVDINTNTSSESRDDENPFSINEGIQ